MVADLEGLDRAALLRVSRAGVSVKIFGMRSALASARQWPIVHGGDSRGGAPVKTLFVVSSPLEARSSRFPKAAALTEFCRTVHRPLGLQRDVLLEDCRLWERRSSSGPISARWARTCIYTLDK